MFFSAASKQFISSAPRGNALKPSRPRRLKRFVAQGAVGVALMATWFAVPAQALTWNWSFTGDVTSGQGTFTTAGTTAQAGITETITAITGTYTRSGTLGDGTYQITGLDNSFFGGSQNFFQWDGTNTSAIISDNSGIEFSTDGGSNVIIFFNGGAGVFSSVGSTSTNYPGYDGSISSSTLSPVLGRLWATHPQKPKKVSIVQPDSFLRPDGLSWRICQVSTPFISLFSLDRAK